MRALITGASSGIGREIAKVLAGVGFMAAGLSSAVVARYAVRQMMRGRTVIIPGLGMRILRILMHLAPDRLMLAGAYSVQKLKGRSS